MSVLSDPGPLVRRRQLGSALRRHRHAAGMSVRDVADSLLCSPAKISRIETAQRNISMRDVRDLCDLYGIGDPDIRDMLMELSRESREPAWWQRYSLSPSLERYIGLEGAATQISDYQLGMIPGLLQTQEYARAVLAEWITDPISLEEAVHVRATRQRVLAAHALLCAIVDESAVRRMVGGPKVMRHQLEMIIEIGESPRNVDVRLIPFSAGAHRGMIGGFTVLQFADPRPDSPKAAMSDVVYLEDVGVGGTYLDQPASVSEYLAKLTTLRERALTTTATVDFLKTAHRDL